MEQHPFLEDLYKRNSEALISFPDKQRACKFIDHLFNFLFLPKSVRNKQLFDLEKEYEFLQNQFSTILYDLIQDSDKAQQITEIYFEAMPRIYNQLLEDAQAILHFDPAAKSIEEVLVTYPGFFSTAIYRLSHELQELKIQLLPRLFTEHAHSKTGIDINPGAQIGSSFFIDHGTGIVIGETAIIGNNVKIYQGVTLGAINVAKELAETKRHPTIENNVIIYSGATILGGSTIIGHDSIIGGNVWLTHGVPSHSIVYNKSEVAVKDNLPYEDVINFVI